MILKKHKGFSLIELLVVVSLGTIIITLTSSSFLDFKKSKILYNESRVIENTLKKLSLESVEKNDELYIQNNNNLLILNSKNSIQLKSNIQISSSLGNKIIFYRSGNTSPGRIKIQIKNKYCEIAISLRGRIKRKCN